MNTPRHQLLLCLTVLACGTLAALAVAQQTAPRAPRAVATVGTARITAEEFERRTQGADRELGERLAALPAAARDMLRRQVLEAMIRMEMLKLEARRTGRMVPLSEAEAMLRKDPFFSPNGTFDDRRWVMARTRQPEQFQTTLANVQAQLSAQRLSAELEDRLMPSPAQLKSEAERELTRVTLEHLSLRLAEFDGRYPEPRESAVFETYMREKSRMRRPDRATVSVVFINTPGLSADERRNPDRVREWTARMRLSADSLISAARQPSDFEVLAAPHGGVRPRVVLTPADFPSYWLGDEAQKARLFRAPLGIFREPVPGPDGFLVVRLDQLVPEHEPSLAEAAKEIRTRLRADMRDNHELYAQRDLYASLRDSLAGPAWRVRWALVDTGMVRVPEPGAAELDRYYRTRLADYSYFDSQQSRIVARSLAEVREDVRARWLRDKRVETARTQADALYRAWSERRRLASIEQAVGARESGPVPVGAELEDLEGLRAVSDTVWGRGTDTPVGLARMANGFLVWWLLDRTDRHIPTFAQARPALQAALIRQREEQDVRAARALFDANPAQFGSRELIHFSRVMLLPPDLMDVQLTEAEVERHYRANIAEYGAPELVRVRHILVEFRDKSDAGRSAAQSRAQALLSRARAGEDFVTLAREHSDDQATRADGGDLGMVGRGTLLPPIESVAFRMQAGQVSDLVETSEGFHILRCTEYVPPVYQPLHLIYTSVAGDLARIHAESLIVQRADSLLRVHRTSAAMARALTQAGFEVLYDTHRRGQAVTVTVARPFYESLETTRAGEVMRPPFRSRGQGVWIAWVDSITRGATATWEESRVAAMNAHRLGAGRRALDAKIAELDSMQARGVSLDSLAAFWGGMDRIADYQLGGGLGRLGGATVVDSLVFGSSTHAPLATATASGWIELPSARSRIRVAGRDYPGEQRLRPRIEALRRSRLEMALRDHFDRLRGRYPVRILDATLRDVPLPDPSGRVEPARPSRP